MLSLKSFPIWQSPTWPTSLQPPWHLAAPDSSLCLFPFSLKWENEPRLIRFRSSVADDHLIFNVCTNERSDLSQPSCRNINNLRFSPCPDIPPKLLKCLEQAIKWISPWLDKPGIKFHGSSSSFFIIIIFFFSTVISTQTANVMWMVGQEMHKVIKVPSFGTETNSAIPNGNPSKFPFILFISRDQEMRDNPACLCVPRSPTAEPSTVPS